MRRPAVTAVLVAITCATPGTIGGVDIPLLARQYEIGRLAPPPGPTSGAVSLQVDAVTGFTLDIVSGVGGLTTQVVLPGGQVVDPTTVGDVGATYTTFAGAVPDSPLAFLTAEAGVHYTYAFPTLPAAGPGTYTVEFGAPTSVADETAVLVELVLDSPVACGLFSPRDVAFSGSDVVLTAAVFDGSTPVTDAQIDVTVAPPLGTPFSVTLVDDGTGGDDATGDGLYSTVLPASLLSQTGEYLAAARITRPDSGGPPLWVREAGTRLVVIDRAATFTASPFSVQGQDDDGNGLFDRLVLGAPLTVSAAGDYQLDVDLTTPGGSGLLAVGRATLLAGSRTLEASVDAAALREAGADGPYTITGARLVFVGSEGAVPSGRLEDVQQTTPAVTLSQFEGAPLALAGGLGDLPVDTDADGDYDVLDVALGVRAPAGGDYTYSGALVDPCAGVVAVVAGHQQLTGGGGQELLTLSFPGAAIGANGLDGPYTVADLLLAGPGGSLVVPTVGTTSAWSATLFDAFTDPPDCNTNGVADRCDLFAGTSSDLDGDGRPDECAAPPAPVPALDARGRLVLALLLAGVGALAMRGRRRGEAAGPVSVALDHRSPRHDRRGKRWR